MSPDEFQARYENFLASTGQSHISILEGYLNSPPGTSDKRLGEELHVDRTYIYRVLRGIIECFGSNYNTQLRNQSRDQLSALFAIYKRHDYPIHPDRLEYLREENYLIPIPENLSKYVPLDSRYYINRGYIESDSYELIERPGNLLRIAGHHRNGKTSLIKLILNYSEEKLNYNTVDIDLKELEHSGRSNLRDFLYWFCCLIRDRSGIQDLPPLPNSSIEDGLLVSCGSYMQTILKKTSTGLVISVDNIDTF